MLRLDKSPFYPDPLPTPCLFFITFVIFHEGREIGEGVNAAGWKNSVDNAPRAKAETRSGNRNTIWRNTVRARDMESREMYDEQKMRNRVLCENKWRAKNGRI